MLEIPTVGREFLARVFTACSVGWVKHRVHVKFSCLHVDWLTRQLGYFVLFDLLAEPQLVGQHAQRCVTHGYQNFGAQQLQHLTGPGPAGLELIGIWDSIVGRPAQNQVGDVALRKRQPNLLHRLPEHFPRFPDEWPPSKVLCLTRGFRQEHHRGIQGSLPRYRPLAALPQLALPALRNLRV